MIRDYFNISWKQVRSRKVRSWLTLIGIFIGIAAIVSLITLGQGLKEAISQHIQSLGSDKLFITPKGNALTMGLSIDAIKLTNDDMEVVQRTAGVKAAAGMIYTTARIEINKLVRYFFVSGLPTDTEGATLIEESQNYRLLKGRLLEKSDKYKAVLGNAYTDKNLFQKEINLGDKILIQNQEFKVVGFLQKIGSPPDDQMIIIPLDTYGSIFNKKDDPSKHFEAKLSKIDGKALDKMEIKEEITKNILKDLKNTSYHITDISKKKQERQPGAPYTTSTLQQDANHKLHYSAKQTMMIAQQLYEGVKLGEVGQTGLISYMRTDSVNLSEKFINEARDFIVSKFGKEAVPEEARRYKTKSRLAQEAHEAIRPTSATRTPEDVKAFLDPKQFRLYELIWKRAIASQMSAAEFENTGFDVLGAEKYTFRATGSRILKNGFLTLYPNDEDVKDLPLLEKGDEVVAQKIEPKQHFTEPPARYSDATLVKIMEENGIGRPSTYAPTINTLIVRKYLDRIEGRRLKPTEIGMIVNDLLVEHFPTIVDYKFTASIEESLDEVAEGKKEWVPIIKEFYGPFHELIEKKKAELVKSEFTETKTDEVCEKCGKPMIVKLGRFGKFLACTGFPDCKNTKPVTDDGKAAPEEKSDEKCPKCGADMIVKHGRFGAFLSCSKYPDCKTMKPILKSTGVRCPKCDKGDIVERRSKRGRTFFGCETYPACDFVLWKKPTGEKCAECSSLMIYGAQEKTYCSNKECKNAPKRGAKKKMTEDEEE